MANIPVIRQASDLFNEEQTKVSSASHRFPHAAPR